MQSFLRRLACLSIAFVLGWAALGIFGGGRAGADPELDPGLVETQAGPGARATISVSGAITSTTTWAAGNTYQVTGDVTVEPGVTLTIEPGVVVTFDGSRSLLVQGTLNAVGTSGQPITFTRSGTFGNWAAIAFRPGSRGSISQARIWYGGSGLYSAAGNYRYTAVLIEDGTPSIAGSTITGTYSTSPGIFVDGPSARPSITGNLLDSPLRSNNEGIGGVTANTFNTTTVGLEIPGGTLTANSTIPGGEAVRLLDSLTVPPTSTLGLAAGSSLLVATSRGLYVDGQLLITGTAAQPVTVTRNGTSGNWSGIAFRPGATGTINQARLSHGGYGFYNSASSYRYTSVLIEGSSPTVANSVITGTYSAEPEILVEDATNGLARPTISGNSFGRSIRVGLESLTGVTSNSFLTTTASIEVPGGTLDASLVWPASNSNPYRLIDTLTIPPTTTLGLTAGTRIRVDSGDGIVIEGGLYLTGTASTPITLTNSAESPSTGQWQGLTFRPGAQGRLEHVRTLNAGTYRTNSTGAGRYAAILIEDAAPTIVNSTITGTYSSGYSVQTDADSSRFPTLTNNTFDRTLRTPHQGVPNLTGTSLALAGATIEVEAGLVAGGETWPGSNSAPYQVLDHLTVGPEATLTINQNAVLRMRSSTQVVVSGTLNLAGASGQPVTLTAHSDSPSPGYWRGIYFAPGSRGTLDRAVIAYGGGSIYPTPFEYYYTSLLIDSSNVSVNNTTIEQSYGHGILLRDGAAPTIDGSTLRRIGTGSTSYRGIFTEDPSARPTIRSNTFISTSIRVPIDGLDRLSGNQFQGTGFGVEPLGSMLGRNHTWTDPGGPFRLLDSLSVPSTTTLTLSPGVTVQFPSGAGLYVTGTLYISGTADAPVRLDSTEPNPLPGAWEGIGLWPGSNGAITHARIRHGGGYVQRGSSSGGDYTSILLDGVNVPVSQTTIEQSYGDGILVVGEIAPVLEGNTIGSLRDRTYHFGIRAVGAGALPTIRSNTFISAAVRLAADGPPRLSNNVFSGASTRVEVDPGSAGRIDGNAIWPNPGVPYHVIGELTIPTIYSLGLTPGTTIRTGNRLVVNGTLNAIGTAAQPIRFTANTETPTRGSWGGLDFRANSFGSLAYAHLSYAGTAIQVNSATASVLSSTIDFSSGNNIYLTNNPTVQIRGNNFGGVNCGAYAVDNSGWSTGRPVADAINNWWGDPLGPSGENYGSGAPVSTGVNFTPWLTAPNASAPALLPGSETGCAPYVYEIQPEFGASSGATPVTIRGYYFRVGAQAALIRRTSVYSLTNMMFVDGSTLQGTVPAGIPEGIYDLKVVNADGSNRTTTDAFSISGDAPSPQRVLPEVGFQDAPTDVVVEGFNFRTGVTVGLKQTFGTEVTLTQTARLDDNRIQATIPPGFQTGAYDVIVRNAGVATPGTLRAGFSVVTTSKLDLFADAYGIWTDPPTPRLGSPVALGLNVQRRGGANSIQVPVRFYLGDPAQGGTVIGDATTAPMPPGAQSEAVSVSWTPPSGAQGAARIFVQIDPDNTLQEENRSNNDADRSIIVQQALPDSTPPDLTNLTLDNGAQSTADTTIQVDVSASDPAPGAGLKGMYLVEREFNASARAWVPISNTGWITFTSPYNLTITDRAGIRFIQGYVSDAAGNISRNQIRTRIDYIPPSDTLRVNQVRVYRRTLAAGETINVRLEPLSGDADLYVWDPRDNSVLVRANSGTLVDEGPVTATVAGVYQIEIFAYSPATYRLTITGGQSIRANDAPAIQPNEEKTQRTAPIVSSANEPDARSSVPIAPVGQAAVPSSTEPTATPTPTTTPGPGTPTATTTPSPTATSDSGVKSIYLPVVSRENRTGW